MTWKRTSSEKSRAAPSIPRWWKSQAACFCFHILLLFMFITGITTPFHPPSSSSSSASFIFFSLLMFSNSHAQHKAATMELVPENKPTTQLDQTHLKPWGQPGNFSCKNFFGRPYVKVNKIFPKNKGFLKIFFWLGGGHSSSLKGMELHF